VVRSRRSARGADRGHGLDSSSRPGRTDQTSARSRASAIGCFWTARAVRHRRAAHRHPETRDETHVRDADGPVIMRRFNSGTSSAGFRSRTGIPRVRGSRLLGVQRPRRQGWRIHRNRPPRYIDSKNSGLSDLSGDLPAAGVDVQLVHRGDAERLPEAVAVERCRQDANLGEIRRPWVRDVGTVRPAPLRVIDGGRGCAAADTSSQLRWRDMSTTSPGARSSTRSEAEADAGRAGGNAVGGGSPAGPIRTSPEQSNSSNRATR